MAELSERYLNQLQSLLPPGRAWPRDDDAELTAFLTGLAEWLAAVHERALDLKREINPYTASELLDEWESSLALDAGSLTEAQRQAANVAKLADMGGARKTRYLALAAALGYTASIEGYEVCTCESTCEAEVWPYWVRFFWKLIVQGGGYASADCMMACTAALRDYTATEESKQLETMIKAITPAISNVIFVYGE